MKSNLDKEQIKKIGFWSAVGALVLGIVIVIAAGGKKQEADAPSAVPTSQEPIVRYITETEIVYVDKLVPVEVEKKITTDILDEKLQDMGELITEEYLFKEVTTFESSKTFAWIIKANSKLIMGYEGTLYAGIDFAGIKTVINENKKLIRVTLPKAEIFACELDLESFELYEEEVSRWNPIKAEDYNGSQLELENRATERALERGILDKAQKNAEKLIKGFIGGLIDLSVYRVEFTEA